MHIYLKNLPYNRFLGALLLASICGIMQAQPNDRPPNEIPGHCYAKVELPELVEVNNIIVPEYIGTDRSIIKDYTIKKKIVLKEETSRWENRPADSGCISKNPEDCMVWCLVGAEEEAVKIKRYLLDTTVTDDYELNVYDRTTVIRPGVRSEWREIICADEIDSSMKNTIYTVLDIPGRRIDLYLDTNPNAKAKLIKYQKKHSLPIGDFDFETLRHMGIDL